MQLSYTLYASLPPWWKGYGKGNQKNTMTPIIPPTQSQRTRVHFLACFSETFKVFYTGGYCPARAVSTALTHCIAADSSILAVLAAGLTSTGAVQKVGFISSTCNLVQEDWTTALSKCGLAYSLSICKNHNHVILARIALLCISVTLVA